METAFDFVNLSQWNANTRMARWNITVSVKQRRTTNDQYAHRKEMLETETYEKRGIESRWAVDSVCRGWMWMMVMALASLYVPR